MAGKKESFLISLFLHPSSSQQNWEMETSIPWVGVFLAFG